MTIVRPSPDWPRFSSLAGVPVHWKGSANQERPRTLAPAFYAALTAAFEEIWRLCPIGPATTIVSLGAYVERECTPGDRHATGTAFDLAELRWAGFPSLLASRAQEDARKYLAVECSLRRHVPQCLDWWTNRDHHSHWHLDDRASASGYSPRSPSDVAFVQALLVHVYGADLEIDGIEGPKTRAALGAIWTPGLSWESLLEEAAKKAWNA